MDPSFVFVIEFVQTILAENDFQLFCRQQFFFNSIRIHPLKMKLY